MSISSQTSSASTSRLTSISQAALSAVHGDAGSGSLPSISGLNGIRMGRASSPTIDELGFGFSAAKSGFTHAAVPETRITPQIQRLMDKALIGGATEITALAEWASVHEYENDQLRQRIRKQQHTFAALMEMVNATASRALDINSLQNYILRTVSGQFAAPRVMIIRQVDRDKEYFTCSSAQGVACPPGVQLPPLRISLNASLCLHALGTASSFSLTQLPDAVAVAPEIDDLLDSGFEIAVPLIQEADHMGVVLEGFLFIGPKLTGKPYTRLDIEFMNVLARLFAISLRNESLYRRSIIDTLTGVASRGHFDAQLSQELNRISAYPGHHLSLIMLDVDHFKKVNDTHGHQTGDMVLQVLSKTLQKGTRSEDLVARYGGEEFAIILTQTSQKVAIEVADRLRIAVASLILPTADDHAIGITVSLGIATFPENAKTAHDLIQLADAALYRSKDLGRNRITVADSDLVVPQVADDSDAQYGF